MPGATNASASISTSIRGSISALTPSIAAAGGAAPKTSCVRAPDLLPAADVGDVHAGPHHVLGRRAGPRQRGDEASSAARACS